MKVMTSGPRPVAGCTQQKLRAVGRQRQRQSRSWQRLWARWQQLLYQQPLPQACIAQEPQVVLLLLQLLQLPRTSHMQMQEQHWHKSTL